MLPIIPHFINGKHVASNDRMLNVFNPATGEVIAHLTTGNQEIVDKAVEAAYQAYQTWSCVTPIKRARILFQFKSILEKNINHLAELIMREHGKTLPDAKGSVQRGIDVVEFACGIPSHLRGTYNEEVGTDIDSYSMRQSLGVCAGITPFNFPAMIPLWMFPISIACGNTFILKPSEKDPSCALKIVELAHEAGIPNGVVNLVQGDKEVVDALLFHPKIQSVSFVGSTPVAEYVYKTASSQHKRVQAFGGAKNHCVVMPDTDMEQTVEAIVGAAYGSAGERCMAISVVVTVGDDIANTLVEKIKLRVARMKIGPGNEPDIEMGPLVTAAHRSKVKSFIDLGEKEGAQLVMDGRDLKIGNGFYLGPTLFDHVTPNMRIYKEEIFGPVLSIVRAQTFEQALKIINENEYGNGTAIFTRDGHTARTFANKVQVGMVGVNIPIPVPVASFSFGGWKRSMFGDLHMHGPESVNFFTKLKTVTERWPKSLPNSSGFIMPTH